MKKKLSYLYSVNDVNTVNLLLTYSYC